MFPTSPQAPSSRQAPFLYQPIRSAPARLLTAAACALFAFCSAVASVGGSSVQVALFATATIWNPDRRPDFPIALYCACNHGSRFEGRRLAVLVDQWGQDWTDDPFNILGRLHFQGPSYSVNEKASRDLPPDFAVLFFDVTDVNGRHIHYPGNPPDYYEGFLGPMAGACEHTSLTPKGSFVCAGSDWADPRHAAVLTLRAAIVLDGEIHAESSAITIRIQRTGAGPIERFNPNCVWAEAGTVGALGPIAEAELALEEILPVGPLREGALHEIDAYDKEASALLVGEAKGSIPTDFVREARFEAAGDRMEQALSPAQKAAVRYRASLLSDQLRVFGCLGGGDGKALLSALSARLQLANSQEIAMAALIPPLEDSERYTNADRAAATTTPLEDAMPVMNAYRKFRVLLTDTQRSALEGGLN